MMELKPGDLVKVIDIPKPYHGRENAIGKIGEV